MAYSPRNSLGNVRPDMDIPYPENLSRLNRHLVHEYPKNQTRNKRNSRPRTRYHTQPVTFDEIQEVDEENTVPENQNNEDTAVTSSSSTPKLNIRGDDYFNIIGSKYKKSKLAGNEKPTGDPDGYSNNKEEPLFQQDAMDQIEQMDRFRETSI